MASRLSPLASAAALRTPIELPITAQRNAVGQCIAEEIERIGLQRL